MAILLYSTNTLSHLASSCCQCLRDTLYPPIDPRLTSKLGRHSRHGESRRLHQNLQRLDDRSCFFRENRDSNSKPSTLLQRRKSHPDLHKDLPTMSGSTPATKGYIAPNFPDPEGPHDAHIIIYEYIPSLALCILAIILFTLSFIVHMFEVYRYRTFYFLPLSLGCALETLGYIFRILSSHKDPYNIFYFVVQYFMIVTAPVFLSASIYVCLSRLITWATNEGFDLQASRGPAQRIRPRAILWGFISCDVISTIIQIAGASLIGKKESDHEVRTFLCNLIQNSVPCYWL